MSELAINYDKKYDILYVDIPSTEPKYGEAGDNGIVTFLGMESDKVLGFFIENFKERYSKHQLKEDELPIHMDINDPIISSLVYGDGKTYKARITA